jgi:HAD superfamily hydrolase (TIGR01509 family)
MEKRAVIFDIDDTLVDTTRCNALCRALAIDRLLASMPGADADRAAVVENHLYKVFGWARMQDLWRAIALELGVKAPPAEDLADIQRLFELDFTARLELFTGVAQTLRLLAERGLSLGIISDGHAGWQWRKLKACGIDSHFPPDKVFISIQSDLHNCKPSTANFRRQERAHGLSPDELVYVGDKPCDVLAANVAGWTSVLTLQAHEGRPDGWPDGVIGIQSPRHRINTIIELPDLL